ncbi:MAG: ABC transporter substrate-binding protein [Oleiphilaceae bacterium]|nr:ABC transporter substrate-binding protein [Oleiphilaceae bacterium]
MKTLYRILSGITAIALLAACGSSEPEKPMTTFEKIQKEGVLKWGADVIGGVPYVYEDPDNPGQYIGFEMDIAKAIAKQLGVKQEMVIRAWDSLVPELQKGAFDMAMNGIENTEDRAKIVQFSEPYFVYSQQITVRKETDGVSTLDDLKGMRVATLSGTAAEDILRGIPEIEVHINPEIIYSYQELEDGSVDAVVLDTPIAAAYGATNPKFKNVGETFAPGHYVIAFRDEDKGLKQAVDQAIKAMKENGELARILTKWGIMNPHQKSIGIQ